MFPRTCFIYYRHGPIPLGFPSSLPSLRAYGQKLTPEQKTLLDSMLRVDQAGELGANMIYQGQMAILGKNPQVGPQIQAMWDQEKQHLIAFDALVREHQVRPTILRPFWVVAGYTLGRYLPSITPNGPPHLFMMGT